MSTSGGSDRQFATVTVRVPQEQFFTALDLISALGKVQSQNVGSEDVSEQFIDLEARLKSSLREEQSLLSLLDKANKVGDVLSIERELSRVRSDIERFQGQLNFLERRVDLATIAASLFSPGVEPPQPPSAFLTVDVSNVGRSVESVKALMDSLQGEVENVIISKQEDSESARMTLRVFSKDFEQALAAVEDQGRVKSLELNEGATPTDGISEPPEDPDARIIVFFEDRAKSSNTGLIVAIAAPVGGVLLAVLLGLLFYLTYRTGRRRSGRA
jgi:hypothetical protein